GSITALDFVAVYDPSGLGSPDHQKDVVTLLSFTTHSVDRSPVNPALGPMVAFPGGPGAAINPRAAHVPAASLR
ncbi:MAG: hypothetical protein ACRDRT_03565, partial [Pseudonocardiaceae bacterium]